MSPTGASIDPRFKKKSLKNKQTKNKKPASAIPLDLVLENMWGFPVKTLAVGAEGLSTESLSKSLGVETTARGESGKENR